MREFKFRAWSEGKMHYSTQYQKVYGGVFIYSIGDGNYGEEKRVTDCIFMQFTGLKDKSGKEIYEGDVLEWTWDNGNKHREVVKWAAIHDEQTFAIGFYFSEELPLHTKLCEVIGNVYENPELLIQEGK